MQPLAYFSVRMLLGWLQYVERAQRAFTTNPLVLVATGTGHCWAVVFALFTAIHIRAMRYEGYHEGYVAHLPVWVSWTESLAVAAMGVWMIAGLATFAIRIVEEEDTSLPTSGKGNFLLQLVGSKKVRDGLALAHTLSCVGLFLSIVLLCIAMACMKGIGTPCELCLCLVSLGFALPHTILAYDRLNLYMQKEGSAQEPRQAIQAAAQEAAALGPQLCMILALADSPSHAAAWQNLVYLVSSVAFVAAVAACSYSPPKLGDTALPPELGELFTCFTLDVVACVGLVISFPHMNTWHSWALFVLVATLFAALWFEDSRSMFTELLDPLLVVRSDADKMLPGKERQHVRKASWVAGLLCATVALGDIILHPAEEGLMEPPVDHAFQEMFWRQIAADRLRRVAEQAHLWEPNAMLLLRYRPETKPVPSEQELLSGVAQALGVTTDSMTTKVFSQEHRFLFFEVNEGGEPKEPAHARWAASVSKPSDGKLAGILDSTFPSRLNTTLCHNVQVLIQRAKQSTTEAGGAAEEPAMPAEFVEEVGSGPGAKEAYMVACDWWEEALHAFSNNDTARIQEGESSSKEGSDLA
mmetsp:Transcript_71135/g.179642  ORF Transcript_71135/g.179642 Transcript_71135/m.179642 type:complete len:583 (+) Transcript_71135:140-1888(+)